MDFQDVVSLTQGRKAHTIRQPRFWLLCHFYLPDEIAEKLPAIDVAKVRGQYLLGFNFKPTKGEYFPYGGHIWQVANHPIQFPARYKTSGRKDCPFVTTKYIETCESEAEMFAALLELSSNN